jgi:hypothetical protein
VSDDFLKIATDIGRSGDSAQTLTVDQLVLKFADDFHKLDTDLHKLDLDVRPLGDDYIKLADALHQPSGPADAPGPGDLLHQVLVQAHNFSLL